LREGLEADGFSVKEYGLTWLPSVTVDVSGSDADRLIALLDILEDNDDVQNLYANYELSDEEMARIAGSA
jgi:transcriptional/translational regulatory protein YebC/TACO1